MQLLKNLSQVHPLMLEHRKTNGSLCEKLLSKIYTLHLKPGDTFIDVGSRVGHHLFPMARIVGAQGHGLGVEANPYMSKDLVKRIEDDNNFSHLSIAAVAAGEAKGEASFYVMRKFTGWSSLYAQHVHPNEPDQPEEVQVNIETLDDIYKSLGWSSCDFIKLDIEHAEFPAIKGGKNLISTHRPLMVFENSPKAAAKLNSYTSADFFGYFESIDYAITDIFFNEFNETRWHNETPLPSYYVASPKEANLSNNESFLSECEAHLQSLISDA